MLSAKHHDGVALWDPVITGLALTLDGPVKLFLDEVKPIESN